MNKQPSVFGGACIIASVCVGAGMLALPSAGSGAWTVWSTAVIVLTMVMMTLSGWLLLEAYKHYDLRASFNRVTRDVLGPYVNSINNLAVYFVGGILLYAYTTTLGDTISKLTDGELSSTIASILACTICGAFVWHSTRAVDRISVLLIVFMIATFVFSIFGLLGNIKLDTLFDTATEHNSYAKYTLMLLPVGLTSFGYHHSVASMRAYYGEERKASRAILYGTLITVCIYLMWMIAIFGNLSRPAFAPIVAADGDVNVLIDTLGNVLNTASMKSIIAAFSLGAVVSSFIGVGLGVFDYLADCFHFNNDRIGRSKSWLVTFIPPLVCSLISPAGFVKAIGYAGAVATIWTCMVPAALAWKTRQRADSKQGFVAPGGRVFIILLFAYGICVALFHFLHMLGKLPVYQG
ncbi:MAG: aromatic amino acid transporter [Cardiobacteriaceae bacterium]|nr:aromatic amino acid transporter [Cardiobacteriaceae bacterium]